MHGQGGSVVSGYPPRTLRCHRRGCGIPQLRHSHLLRCPNIDLLLYTAAVFFLGTLRESILSNRGMTRRSDSDGWPVGLGCGIPSSTELATAPVCHIADNRLDEGRMRPNTQLLWRGKVLIHIACTEGLTVETRESVRVSTPHGIEKGVATLERRATATE